jgi:hypothetical protein
VILTKVIKNLDGSRILIAEKELDCAVGMARTMAQAGATVLGPTGTLAETCSLMRRSKPNIAVLDLGLGAGDWPSFVEELIERRLPALFYVKMPEPRPRLLLRNQVAYPAGPQDEEMLPVIVSLVRARWPARPLGAQRA